MAQEPVVSGVRICQPYDSSFTRAQMEAEAQRLRDHGSTNVTVEEDPATGGWIICSDNIAPP